MKQRIMSAVVLTMIMISTTFATGIEDNVNQKVLATFSHRFENAKNVKWVTTESYIKASFSWNEKSLFAFYTEDGELIGILSNILSTQLPVSLQADMKNLTEGWITELFEFSSDSGTSYYLTIENADEQMTYKSTNGDSWSFYKKVKLP